MTEIAQISGQQQSILRQCDSGDLEVLRADADFLSSQLVEDVCRSGAQWKNVPLSEKLKQAS